MTTDTSGTLRSSASTKTGGLVWSTVLISCGL
jgi:hypothetical protein